MNSIQIVVLGGLLATLALTSVTSYRKDDLIAEQHAALEVANTALTEAQASMSASVDALSSSNDLLRQCRDVLLPPATDDICSSSRWLCDATELAAVAADGGDVVVWSGCDGDAEACTAAFAVLDAAEDE